MIEEPWLRSAVWILGIIMEPTACDLFKLKRLEARERPVNGVQHGSVNHPLGLPLGSPWQRPRGEGLSSPCSVISTLHLTCLEGVITAIRTRNQSVIILASWREEKKYGMGLVPVHAVQGLCVAVLAGIKMTKCINDGVMYLMGDVSHVFVVLDDRTI
jgi:hypothetical protein